jgi:transposase
MRPTGTKQQLEMRRRVAMAFLDIGWGIRQGARQVKASPGSVCRWRDARAQHGEAGLDAQRHPGSKPRLTAAQRARLVPLLHHGACAHGWRNALWTLKRMAALIARHWGLSYGPSGVWRRLRRCQWSPQPPARHSRDRDEVPMAPGPTDVWPRRNKSPA